MALVVTTIIRDGTVPVPYLVDSVQSAAGDLVSKTQPAVLSQALSPETASVTRDVMARAITQGLESDKCPLITKTGTTQLGPGVEPHTWLLGFFPPEKPRYAIVVLIENGGPDARQVHTIACAVVHAAASQ
jgi:peptidoglycan glycosyltransferase